MNTYKITNVTNLAGKRDSKYNMTLDIEYIDNRTKKIINLKAGESVFLTVSSLPLSVHRLRIKNLVVISEVSATELQKSMDKPKPTQKLKSTKKIVEKKKESINDKDIEPISEKKTNTSKKKSVDE